jgi:hypothetical protein
MIRPIEKTKTAPMQAGPPDGRDEFRNAIG